MLLRMDFRPTDARGDLVLRLGRRGACWQITRVNFVLVPAEFESLFFPPTVISVVSRLASSALNTGDATSIVLRLLKPVVGRAARRR